MTARRTRRINSSDLPLNITPEMTSIHPGRPACWNMGTHVTRGLGRGATFIQGDGAVGRGEGGARKASKLADFRGISHSSSVFMRVSAPPLQGDRSEQG